MRAYDCAREAGQHRPVTRTKQRQRRGEQENLRILLALALRAVELGQKAGKRTIACGTRTNPTVIPAIKSPSSHRRL